MDSAIVPVGMAAIESNLPRTINFGDLVYFKIAAIINLTLIPAIVAQGGWNLHLWLSAFLFFYIPSMFAVVELSKRYPGQGGIYLWTTVQFGHMHGFLSGWCYWVNNVFYIPMLCIYFFSSIAFLLGLSPQNDSVDRSILLIATFAWLMAISVLSVFSSTIVKWIQRLGASCTVLAAGIVILAAAMAAPSSTTHLSLTIEMSWERLVAFNVICLSFVGVELASTMGAEIKCPNYLGLAACIAGVIAFISYATVSAALVILAQDCKLSSTQGFLESIAIGSERTSRPWIATATSLLLILSIAGSSAAWFTGSCRLPFAAALNRSLPNLFARINPKSSAPSMSILVTGAFCLASNVLVLAGSEIAEAYQILLKCTVIIQLIPFLYLFLGFLLLPRIRRFHRASAVAGLSATALGILTALIPPEEVDSIGIFECKVAIGVTFFLALGALIFFYARSRLIRP